MNITTFSSKSDITSNKNYLVCAIQPDGIITESYHVEATSIDNAINNYLDGKAIFVERLEEQLEKFYDVTPSEYILSIDEIAL